VQRGIRVNRRPSAGCRLRMAADAGHGVGATSRARVLLVTDSQRQQSDEEH
jgi:hypothetical protein